MASFPGRVLGLYSVTGTVDFGNFRYRASPPGKIAYG